MSQAGLGKLWTFSAVSVGLTLPDYTFESIVLYVPFILICKGKRRDILTDTDTFGFYTENKK